MTNIEVSEQIIPQVFWANNCSSYNTYCFHKIFASFSQKNVKFCKKVFKRKFLHFFAFFSQSVSFAGNQLYNWLKSLFNVLYVRGVQERKFHILFLFRKGLEVNGAFVYVNKTNDLPCVLSSQLTRYNNKYKCWYRKGNQDRILNLSCS